MVKVILRSHLSSRVVTNGIEIVMMSSSMRMEVCMVIMMVKVLTRMAERERHSGRRNFSLGWIRDGTDLGFVMSTSHLINIIITRHIIATFANHNIPTITTKELT